MKMGALNFFCCAVLLVFTQTNILAIDITNEWRKAASDFNQHDYESALSHFNLALAADPDNLPILMSRGGCYVQLKKFADAEKDYDLAVKLSTNNLTASQTLCYRGNFYSQNTNLGKALDDFSKAIEYNPSSALAYASRANIETQTGDNDGAMQDCNMAIMLNPEITATYELRGRLFLAKSQYDKSIVDFTKAVCLDTNNPSYYYLRGMALAGKDEGVSAINDFSKAIQIAGDIYSPLLVAECYSDRGLMLSRTGQFKKAIEDCKRGFELNTNSAACLNNLAWLLATAPDAKLRNGKLAVEYATRACELSNWQNAYNVGTLAAAYAEIGNFDEAVKWEKKCIFLGMPPKENVQAHKELDLFEEKQPYHAKK